MRQRVRSLEPRVPGRPVADDPDRHTDQLLDRLDILLRRIGKGVEGGGGRNVLGPTGEFPDHRLALPELVGAVRGLLDYHEKVATYWPEVAQNGKADIKVRHLMAHTSGVSAWEQPVDVTDLAGLLAALPTGRPEREAASKAAREQSRRFSWTTSAGQLAEVFSRAAASPNV